MNICRVWREHTSAKSVFDKKGLRYDAGDWFAEIYEDEWKSYDVISRSKVSLEQETQGQQQVQIQEILRLHSVPRLPRDCYFLEEFAYQHISPQVQHIEGWIVEESVLPLTQVQQVVQKKQLQQKKEQVQEELHSQQMQHNRRNKMPMIAGQLSSNQSYHVQPLPDYPKQPVEHSQQKRAKPEVHQKKAYQDGPQVHSWIPLELHLSPPSQLQQQASSFQNQRGKQRSSHGRPKMLPRKQQLQHSSVPYPKSHQHISSVCQIQD